MELGTFSVIGCLPLLIEVTISEMHILNYIIWMVYFVMFLVVMTVLTGYICLKLCLHKKAMSRHMSRHMLRHMSRPTRNVQDNFRKMILFEATILYCGFILRAVLQVLENYHLLPTMDAIIWSQMTTICDPATTLFIYVATSPAFRSVLNGYCRNVVVAPYKLYLNTTGRAKICLIATQNKKSKKHVSGQPILMKF